MLVLFVDDDPDDYDIFCEALRTANSNIKCIHAPDGKAAIDLLRDGIPKLPDYIFLDVNMPIMGGKECLIRIKEIPKAKNIPVIMYSTTKNPKEIIEYKQLGAKEFVVKPGTFEMLVNTLKKII